MNSFSYRRKSLNNKQKIDLNQKEEVQITDEKYIISNTLFLLGVFNGYLFKLIILLNFNF